MQQWKVPIHTFPESVLRTKHVAILPVTVGDIYSLLDSETPLIDTAACVLLA